MPPNIRRFPFDWGSKDSINQPILRAWQTEDPVPESDKIGARTSPVKFSPNRTPASSAATCDQPMRPVNQGRSLRHRHLSSRRGDRAEHNVGPNLHPPARPPTYFIDPPDHQGPAQAVAAASLPARRGLKRKIERGSAYLQRADRRITSRRRPMRPRRSRLPQAWPAAAIGPHARNP